ncbi:hypothetical protein BT96DRAFT_967250 [Gymnopus androsaceus JB14]|uniref:Probable 26S proteasome regulatory subunit p27 n=1 Tax=Gymnopus androsaceus JB14 TaxID=1447944 RepID=A0A6A4H633_9AGAR|nr:hypothetical protein BT96DRAFT_967250 [Gymnopus androsaceus JB14]
MGFTLPSPDSPAEQAKKLMDQKKNIESQIETNIEILKANQSTMQTPLVDKDGFPRADVDIYAVRGARVRIIELRNDLKDVTCGYWEGFGSYLRPDVEMAEPSETPKPFAKVDGVAPGSPAADAGLQREDLIVKFGELVHASFTSGSLTPVAELVGASENKSIGIKILRQNQSIFLSLTPRKGWGGRGMLGCHIVPLSP